MNDDSVSVNFTVERSEAEYLLTQVESSLRSLALGGTLGMTSEGRAKVRIKFGAIEKLGKALARAMGDKEGHD